jgi:hypothetical protein
MVALVLAVLPLALLLPGWSRGFAAGVWLSSGAWLIVFTVVLATGTAPRMMGDQGEKFTASELRRLRRRGWRVINRVALKRGWDIDHVAIGRGGVLVIETKWSADPWTLDADADDRVRRAVERTASHARNIHRMVPNHVASVAIVPVVVLWGGNNSDDLPLRVIDGVTVLRGTDLRLWLAARAENDALTTDQQDHVWDVLERTVRGRDAFDLDKDGAPQRTPGEWAFLVGAVVLTACVGVLASAAAWNVTKSFPWFFTIESAFFLVGVATLRHRSLAVVGNAWIASVLVVSTLVATAAVASVL